MLVSAISANRTMTALNAGYNHINSRGGDNSGETTSNVNAPKDLSKVYSSINEWKRFCHSQIANGKLDVIA